MARSNTPAMMEALAALQMIGVEPTVLDDDWICDSVLRRLCGYIDELRHDRKLIMTRGRAESHLITMAVEAGVATNLSPLGEGLVLADPRLANLLERCLERSFGNPH